MAWLNNKTAFNLSMQFAPPDLFVFDVNGQKKGRDAAKTQYTRHGLIMDLHGMKTS
ncbi:hypothetical protein HYS31_07035 [Candidatus Woesearchaeota archaeon]|nr:hypothetical protein [Candidatus Woesearchaeota archaeon]